MSKVKAKAVQSVIRLVIKAGQAKPAPPVGPALGQAGLNLMAFCKDFNAKTADIKVPFVMQHYPAPYLHVRQAHEATLVSAYLAAAHRPVPHKAKLEVVAGLNVTQGRLFAAQEDVPVPVSITAYTDKTFTYVRMPMLPAVREHRCEAMC